MACKGHGVLEARTLTGRGAFLALQAWRRVHPRAQR
jgi:hypothetical protein